MKKAETLTVLREVGVFCAMGRKPMGRYKRVRSPLQGQAPRINPVPVLKAGQRIGRLVQGRYLSAALTVKVQTSRM